MAKRKELQFSKEVKKELERISHSRSEAMGKVRRAKILLLYGEGKRKSEIAQEMEVNRPLIDRVINKALTWNPLEALKDLPRPGRTRRITDAARSWVLSLACCYPPDLGYANETWSYRLMIKHIRKHCRKQGYPRLAKLGKGRLNAILSKGNIKPHKIRYYLERRDPNFDEKMAQVLCVYKQVEIQNASKKKQKSVTISYDEKPGIQAIGHIAAQLLPVVGQYATSARDHQYKRLGTVSLLAGIDLHNGEVIPLVRERHRSSEFIEFLQKLDTTYPGDWKIRLILDNHSAHSSKETQTYLRTRLGRFEFVFTPPHGSWLNLVEVFFSKIARSILRHIRVQSKQELIDRIYLGIKQINTEPVIFRWRYKMDEVHAN